MVILHFINLIYESSFDLKLAVTTMGNIRELKEVISRKDELINTLQIIYKGNQLNRMCTIFQLILINVDQLFG